MKTKTIAATALIAILLAVVATAAVADSGVMAGDSHGQGDNHQGDENGIHMMACDNLTVGETLTVSGLTGHFLNASSPAGDDDRAGGNASGTFTFKVTGVYAEGCAISISSGNFKLNATSYSVTGGTIVLNHDGRSGEGSGTTSGGSFLIGVAGLHGNSTSANVGAVRLDFETGSSQFLVLLHSPLSSHAGEGAEDDGGD